MDRPRPNETKIYTDAQRKVKVTLKIWLGILLNMGHELHCLFYRQNDVESLAQDKVCYKRMPNVVKKFSFWNIGTVVFGESVCKIHCFRKTIEKRHSACFKRFSQLDRNCLQYSIKTFVQIPYCKIKPFRSRAEIYVMSVLETNMS